MRRLAVLSMHTSPLAQPGTGDGGGMNVYVRELSAALARSGVACEVFTRRWSPDLPAVVQVEPGFNVHHVAAGPPALVAKETLQDHVEEFTESVLARIDAAAGGTGESLVGPVDAVHANYWLSGLAGHTIKHRLDLPLVSTFHTLDRVKAEASPEEVESASLGAAPSPRRRSSGAPTRCWPPATSSSSSSSTCTARTPGGSTSCRSASIGRSSRPATAATPGGRSGSTRTGRCCCSSAASSRSRVPTSPSAALRSLVEAGLGGARLVLVGGPSGPHGDEALKALHDFVESSGLGEQVVFVPPQRHELLSTYYRAADCCLVPSRSESFGLVALEAAACGTPVVASAVGGLTTLVDHGRTGFLVEAGGPDAFAAFAHQICTDAALQDARRPGGGRPCARLHVVDRGGEAPAPVHRPHVAGPRRMLKGRW